MNAKSKAHLRVVQVCVEHDDGVREDVGRVGVGEGASLLLEVVLREVLHDARNLLRLAREAKGRQKLYAGRGVRVVEAGWPHGPPHQRRATRATALCASRRFGRIRILACSALPCTHGARAYTHLHANTSMHAGAHKSLKHRTPARRRTLRSASDKCNPRKLKDCT